MVNELDYLKESASQTAGPYVHIGLAPNQAGFDIFEKNFTNVVAPPGAAGERITIEGRVIDGSGTPVRDVLIEIWQANAAGKYNHPGDKQVKGGVATRCLLNGPVECCVPGSETVVTDDYGATPGHCLHGLLQRWGFGG